MTLGILANQEVQDLLERGFPHFVLELCDVQEAGAPFLGLLMTLTRLIRQADGEVVLACLSRSVTKGIEEMQLDEYWDHFPNVEVAVAFFEGATA